MDFELERKKEGLEYIFFKIPIPKEIDPDFNSDIKKLTSEETADLWYCNVREEITGNLTKILEDWGFKRAEPKESFFDVAIDYFVVNPVRNMAKNFIENLRKIDEILVDYDPGIWYKQLKYMCEEEIVYSA